MKFFAILVMGFCLLVVIQGLFFAISPDTAQTKTGIRLSAPESAIRALGLAMVGVGALCILALRGFL